MDNGRGSNEIDFDNDDLEYDSYARPIALELNAIAIPRPAFVPSYDVQSATSDDDDDDVPDESSSRGAPLRTVALQAMYDTVHRALTNICFILLDPERSLGVRSMTSFTHTIGLGLHFLRIRLGQIIVFGRWLFSNSHSCRYRTFCAEYEAEEANVGITWELSAILNGAVRVNVYDI